VGVFRPEQKRGYLQTPAPPEKIAHVVSDRLARSETGRGGVLTRRTVVAYASALSLSKFEKKGFASRGLVREAASLLRGCKTKKGWFVWLCVKDQAGGVV
jgi:hypothetical protein